MGIYLNWKTPLKIDSIHLKMTLSKRSVKRWRASYLKLGKMELKSSIMMLNLLSLVTVSMEPLQLSQIFQDQDLRVKTSTLATTSIKSTPKVISAFSSHNLNKLPKNLTCLRKASQLSLNYLMMIFWNKTLELKRSQLCSKRLNQSHLTWELLLKAICSKILLLSQISHQPQMEVFLLSRLSNRLMNKVYSNLPLLIKEKEQLAHCN